MSINLGLGRFKLPIIAMKSSRVLSAKRGLIAFLAPHNSHAYHCNRPELACKAIGAGSVADLLSGLLGVGGGFIIVPSLRKVSNYDTQSIIATSLAVIALVSAGSVTSYLLQGDISWDIAVPFVVSTMLDMFFLDFLAIKYPTKLASVALLFWLCWPLYQW
jgi:uncharacterized membrane protein YfcA